MEDKKFPILMRILCMDGISCRELVYTELLQKFWVRPLGNLAYYSGETWIFKYEDHYYLRNSMGIQIKEPDREFYKQLVGDEFDEAVHNLLRDAK